MRRLFPRYLLWLCVATIAAPLACGAEDLPRLGIISDPAIRSKTDLLLIELQKAKCEMVERDEIGKIVGEQVLQASLNRTETLRIGRLLRADGLVLVAPGTNHTVSVRLVAVAPGVVVWKGDLATDRSWVPTVAGTLAAYMPKLSVKAGDAVPVSVLPVRPAFGMAHAIRLADDLTRLLLLRLVREPSLFVLERENLSRVADEATWSGQDSEFWAGSYVLEGRVSYDLLQTNRVTFVLAVRPPPGGGKIAVGGKELVETGDAANLTAMVEGMTAQLRGMIGTAFNGPAWDPQAEAARLMGIVESLEDPDQQKAAMATVMALGRRDARTAGAYRNTLRTAAYRDPSRFTDLNLRLAEGGGIEKQARDFLELLRFHNTYQPPGGFTSEGKAGWFFCYFQPLVDAERFLAAIASAGRAKDLAGPVAEIQQECRETAGMILKIAPYEAKSLVAVRTARYQYGTTREILNVFRKWLFPPRTDPAFEGLGILGGLWFLDRQLADPVLPASNAEAAVERDRLWQEYVRELDGSGRLELQIAMAVHHLQEATKPEDRVTRRRVLQGLFDGNRRVFRFGDRSGALGYAYPGFRFANGTYSVVSGNNSDFEVVGAQDVKEDARQARRLFLSILQAGVLGPSDANALIGSYLSLYSEEEARTVYQSLRRYMPCTPLAPRLRILDFMEVLTGRFPSVMDDGHRAEIARRAETNRVPEDALDVTDIVSLPSHTNGTRSSVLSLQKGVWTGDRLWFCWGNDSFLLDPFAKSCERLPIAKEQWNLLGNSPNTRMVTTASVMAIWSGECAADESVNTVLSLRLLSENQWRSVRLPFEIKAFAQVGRKSYMLTAVRQITVYQNFGLVEMDASTLECRTLRPPGVPPPKVARAGKEVGFDDLAFLDYDLTAVDGMLVGYVGRERYGWDPETGAVRSLGRGQTGQNQTNSPAMWCPQFGFDVVLDVHGYIRIAPAATPRLTVKRVGSSDEVSVPLLFHRNPDDPAQSAVSGRATPTGVGGHAIQTPKSFLVPCLHQRYFWQIPYSRVQEWLAANALSDSAADSGVRYAFGPGAPAPGDVLTVDLGRGVTMSLCWIPPGEFTMGSPETEFGRQEDEVQHRVAITRGFWMGKFEVTQEQWTRVMGKNPSMFGHRDGWKAPVETVSWNDCQAFLGKLAVTVAVTNRRPEIACLTFRLPTEAEWEYACRAGTRTALHNGKELTFPAGRCRNLDEIAWYESEFNNGPTVAPRPEVGKKKANAWGLHDMSGSASEWCQDWSGDYPKGDVVDPQGPATGTNRVLRGGTWFDFAGYCRSAARQECEPGRHATLAGLRVVLAPAGVEQTKAP